MRRTVLIFLALVFTLMSVSCGGAGGYYDSEYFLMDSYMTVRLSDDGLSEEELAKISRQVSARVKEIEGEISATDSASDVYAFNVSEKGISEAGEDFAKVLEVSMTIAELTDGAYDPTVRPLAELWNIAGGGPVPSAEDISESLTHVGYDKLTPTDGGLSKSDPKTAIDFGGIGKGYAIQCAVELLSASDVSYGLCSFGSTVGVFGKKEDGEAFRITVCDPRDPAAAAGEFRISNGYISSSGDYERYFEVDGVRYHHILDPKTGSPVNNSLRGVTVHAGNGQLSDALSTALFVMGLEKGLDFYESGKLDFEAVFITDEGIYLTEGLKNDGSFSVVSEKYKILN